MSDAIARTSPHARLAPQSLRTERETDLAIAGARSGTPGLAQAEAADEPLSAIGRAIAALARQVPAPAERAQGLERAVLTGIGAPQADPGAASGELRGVLERSGLFYEAHLRAWSAGERTLAELMREPQARLGAALAPAPLAAEDPDRAAAPAPRPADAAPATGPALMPRALEPLVREQLATLETRTAVVPLLVWPGQEATLEIAGEPQPEREREPGASAGAAGAGQATLRLDLPRLGAVEFAVSVRDERVRVTARAARAASRDAFAAGAGALHQALARNALVLERLAVAGDTP